MEDAIPESKMGTPIPEGKWKKGYDDIKTRYVNYQYHDEVCAVSLKRYDKIQSLEAQLSEVRGERDRLKDGLIDISDLSSGARLDFYGENQFRSEMRKINDTTSKLLTDTQNSPNSEDTPKAGG